MAILEGSQSIKLVVQFTTNAALRSAEAFRYVATVLILVLTNRVVSRHLTLYWRPELSARLARPISIQLCSP